MEELERVSNECPEKKILFGFFMATYGEGEPTDSATDFYSYIMNGNGIGSDNGNQEDEMTESRILQNLNYFIFGLGNSTYENFNAIGSRLDTRFEKLGGKRLLPLGCSDDDKRFFLFILYILNL